MAEVKAPRVNGDIQWEKLMGYGINLLSGYYVCNVVHVLQTQAKLHDTANLSIILNNIKKSLYFYFREEDYEKAEYAICRLNKEILTTQLKLRYGSLFNLDDNDEQQNTETEEKPPIQAKTRYCVRTNTNGIRIVCRSADTSATKDLA
jgi:hypothetical protein